jgi:hypothetical protein
MEKKRLNLSTGKTYVFIYNGVCGLGDYGKYRLEWRVASAKWLVARVRICAAMYRELR